MSEVLHKGHDALLRQAESAFAYQCHTKSIKNKAPTRRERDAMALEQSLHIEHGC